MRFLFTPLPFISPPCSPLVSLTLDTSAWRAVSPRILKRRGTAGCFRKRTAVGQKERGRETETGRGGERAERLDWRFARPGRTGGVAQSALQRESKKQKSLIALSTLPSNSGCKGILVVASLLIFCLIVRLFKKTNKQQQPRIHRRKSILNLRRHASMHSRSALISVVLVLLGCRR